MTDHNERQYLDNRTDTREYDRNDENKKTKTNWWPLLLLPIAFMLGWGVGDASDNNNRSAQSNQTEYGVGGGPGDIYSPLPSSSPVTFDEGEVIVY